MTHQLFSKHFNFNGFNFNNIVTAIQQYSDPPIENNLLLRPQLSANDKKNIYYMNSN